MPVFISHSDQDKERFQNLCVALDGHEVPRWNPESLQAGLSLRDQLRQAIRECDACIYQATLNSLASQWCHAELGAFWGAGKRVIIYLDDPAAKEDDIPPQFRGDLWTRSLSAVIEAVRAELDAAEMRRGAEAATPPSRISDLTVPSLFEMMAALQRPAQESRSFQDTVLLLSRCLSRNPGYTDWEKAEWLARLLPILHSLVGTPEQDIPHNIGDKEGSWLNVWGGYVALETNTGTWRGYGRLNRDMPSVHAYSECILFLCAAGEVHSVAAVEDIWASPITDQDGKCDTPKLVSVIAEVGTTRLGSPIKLWGAAGYSP